jgi:hypothetical protein
LLGALRALDGLTWGPPGPCRNHRGANPGTTLCYAIAGRKSVFRAGFWPDCYRESPEALRPAFGQLEGRFRCLPGSIPAKIRPGRPISGPEALLRSIGQPGTNPEPAGFAGRFRVPRWLRPRARRTRIKGRSKARRPVSGRPIRTTWVSVLADLWSKVWGMRGTLRALEVVRIVFLRSEPDILDFGARRDPPLPKADRRRWGLRPPPTFSNAFPGPRGRQTSKTHPKKPARLPSGTQLKAPVAPRGGSAAAPRRLPGAL